MTAFHIRQDNVWMVLDLKIKYERDYAGITIFQVTDAYTGHFYGRIERIKNHVSHQVHGRIRYDNKPVTVWRSLPAFAGLYDDTRSEALSSIVFKDRHHGRRHDIHLAYRPPSWVGCPLHKRRIR